jgi:lysozyme
MSFLIPGWKDILRRAHSIKAASLVVFFSSIGATIQSWQLYDLHSLPIPTVWADRVTLAMAIAAMLCGAMTIFLRLVSQPVLARLIRSAFDRFVSDTGGAVRKQVTVLGGVTLACVAAFQFAYTSGWEGVKFKPYRDVVGVLTVCIGHTGPDIVPGKTYSKAECQALFESDMATVVDGPLSACLRPPQPLKPEVIVAVRDFTFNVGGGAACNSTLMRKINSGDTAGACEEFARWINAGGRPIYGLKVRRMIGVPDRLSEADLCRAGL